MTTQPKPLFLADVINNDPTSKAHHDEAAFELRRLHAEVEALRATLAAFHFHCKHGDGLRASTIVAECEKAVPALATIDLGRSKT
jgi:hypothetical protein